MSGTIRNTPVEVAEKMVRQFDRYHSPQRVLEPSAGEGSLIDVYNKRFEVEKSKIFCIELNKDKCDVLKEKGYNAIHNDFLKIPNENIGKFNSIIAAPPFKGNSDIHHIMKMYDLLIGGGVMVSLTSPFWVTNNEEHQVMFRKFLEDKSYQLTMLPDNSFMEKGKTVHTMIIRIIKTENSTW